MEAVEAAHVHVIVADVLYCFYEWKIQTRRMAIHHLIQMLADWVVAQVVEADEPALATHLPPKQPWHTIFFLKGVDDPLLLASHGGKGRSIGAPLGLGHQGSNDPIVGFDT